MKKVIFLLLAFILVFHTISAIDVVVKKISSDEIMVAGVDKPAVFDLQVTNNAPDDSFQFYNLLGFSMTPIGTVPISFGQTKDIRLEVKPIGDFEFLGPYTFTYYIRASDGSETKQSLSFRRVTLDDIFEVGAQSFDPESSSIELYVKNKENFNFGKVDVKFKSAFFDFEKSFSIGPNDKVTTSVELNKEDFKQLIAGFYTFDADINAGEASTHIEGNLEFSQKNILTAQEKNYGVLITTKIIKKTNDGNVVEVTDTQVKKNIISRLFTTFSPEPDNVQREGATIYYSWSTQLNPGENFEVSVKTNYLYPVIIILLVIVIVILAKLYSSTNLSLNKKVSFVKTKGGEFALKVSIYVHAKKYLENVSVIDRLPPLVKLYEKFGAEHPRKVDEKLKRLEWGFEKLEAGEVRLISYIIYSKVGVLGKFALPSATGLYEKDGKVHETISNRAFLVSEQRTKDLVD